MGTLHIYADRTNNTWLLVVNLTAKNGKSQTMGTAGQGLTKSLIVQKRSGPHNESDCGEMCFQSGAEEITINGGYLEIPQQFT